MLHEIVADYKTGMCGLHFITCRFIMQYIYFIVTHVANTIKKKLRTDFVVVALRGDLNVAAALSASVSDHKFSRTIIKAYCTNYIRVFQIWMFAFDLRVQCN